MRIPAILALTMLFSTPVIAAEHYKDVPKDHWAAEAVQAVANAGVMNGYPDDTFKGDKPVTRYELAAALQAMIQFIQKSEQPLPVKTDQPKAQSGKPDKPQKAATSKAVAAPKEHWAALAKDFLKNGNFLPKDSPVLKDGDKPVSQKELSDALSSVAARLIENRVPQDPVDVVN